MTRTLGWLAGLALLLTAGHYMNQFAQSSVLTYVVTLTMGGLIFTVGMWLRPLIDHIVEPRDGDSRNVFMTLIAVAFAMMTAVFVFAASTDWDGLKLGTYGDFIGGTLNPILTFLTFVGLLFTIILQQRELQDTKASENSAKEALKEQRKVAARQQFENTFFEMLTLHNTIVNSLDLRSAPGDSPKEWHGRDCFERYYASYRAGYNKGREKSDELQRLDGAYNHLWDLRQQDLAHYFRYLYNVIKFVDEYVPKIEGIEKYIKLLRAQLSDYELLMLFYNGLSVNGVNYRSYIIKYKLFDNMPQDKLLQSTHKGFYPDAAYGAPKDNQRNREWYASMQKEP